MPSKNLYPGIPGLKILVGSVTATALAPNNSSYTTVSYPAGCGYGLVLAGIIDTVTSGGQVSFVTDGTGSANALGVNVLNTSASTSTITVTFHAFILPGL